MSLSLHQARREHVLAVSRDFNSQPRLSEFLFLQFFFSFSRPHTIFLYLKKKNIRLSSTPEMNVVRLGRVKSMTLFCNQVNSF